VETRLYAFRRAKTRPGYRKIEAEVYMPAAHEAFVPNAPKCAIYAYVAVERPGGGGEFGLTIQPVSSGGRWVVLVYRSIPGLSPSWAFITGDDGRLIELPAGRTYRLVAAADDGMYRTWVYDAAGNRLVYREWRTGVSKIGPDQHVRRVASLFTAPGVRAYGTVRWRNVTVGTPSETRPMGPADLEGGAPENRTGPPGYEDDWIRVTTYRAYSDEDVTMDITGLRSNLAAGAAVAASPFAAVAAARLLERWSPLAGLLGAILPP
jgi:hypothetical protein